MKWQIFNTTWDMKALESHYTQLDLLKLSTSWSSLYDWYHTVQWSCLTFICWKGFLFFYSSSNVQPEESAGFLLFFEKTIWPEDWCRFNSSLVLPTVWTPALTPKSVGEKYPSTSLLLSFLNRENFTSLERVWNTEKIKCIVQFFIPDTNFLLLTCVEKYLADKIARYIHSHTPKFLQWHWTPYSLSIQQY